ncbi:MAG: thioredoxin family protein, partial [archaeon]
INILNNKNLAKEYDIKTVPTLFLEFNNSSLKVSGSQSKEEIISYINQIKEGDFQNLTSSSSNEETQLCNINQMTECEMEMNLDD